LREPVQLTHPVFPFAAKNLEKMLVPRQFLEDDETTSRKLFFTMQMVLVSFLIRAFKNDSLIQALQRTRSAPGMT
jgi:hypothetical protein